MDYTAFYREVYRTIGRYTPLDIDCGLLCNARCCRGGTSSGMLLYPHEPAAASLRVTNGELRGIDCSFAVCNGRCVRALRPLSCRVFPLAPYYRDGTLRIIIDPRAKFCPLTHGSEFIRTEFREAVEAAFTKLLTLDGMLEFLAKLSDVLDDYAKF